MIINQHLSTNYFAARTGITSDIKDAITLIIENRPEDPIAFMAELWVSRSASSDLRVYKNWKFHVSINNIFWMVDLSFDSRAITTTALVKAHQKLLLVHHSRPSFQINLAAAYNILKQQKSELIV